MRWISLRLCGTMCVYTRRPIQLSKSQFGPNKFREVSNLEPERISREGPRSGSSWAGHKNKLNNTGSGSVVCLLFVCWCLIILIPVFFFLNPLNNESKLINEKSPVKLIDYLSAWQHIHVANFSKTRKQLSLSHTNTRACACSRGCAHASFQGVNINMCACRRCPTFGPVKPGESLSEFI